MLTTVGAALSTLTTLQVVAVVAITLFVIVTPYAIYKGIKNRKEIGNSIGNFAAKCNPKNWRSGSDKLVESSS